MSDQFDRPDGVVSHVIDGSVKIDSVEEFENVLKIFPADPALHRAFGDLLAKKKSFDAAAGAYGTAAELFIGSGRMLQALVAKILEWRIHQPSHRDGRTFHMALRKGVSDGVALQGFLAQMTYPEMVAFATKLVRVSFAAGKTVKRFGDVDNHMCFVVSGALKESMYLPLEEGEDLPRKSSVDLVEGDFFGDVYPFEEEFVSPSEIGSITRAELVAISKPRLRAICSEYPNVEGLISALYEARKEPSDQATLPTVRRTLRHQVPTKVNIKVYEDEADKEPLVVDGFTEDISLGGALVVLGSRHGVGRFQSMVGKNVEMEMSLPTQTGGLSILGKIVWSKDFSDAGKISTALGVRFRYMNEPDRDLLEQYCHGSDGEQNMIWDLWESLVKE